MFFRIPVELQELNSNTISLENQNRYSKQGIEKEARYFAHFLRTRANQHYLDKLVEHLTNI